MKRVVIFASGFGSNVKRIIEHFKDNRSVEISALFTNKKDCGAAGIAAENGVPVVFFSGETKDGDLVDKLNEKKPDLIVLAGFLKLLPADVINLYRGKIINIHPALLPKFGGKGFYGEKVHKAVIDAGEKTTGISIHFVDEEYDKGKIILQEECAVSPSDTPDTLAEKVRQLEHAHYPQVIEKMLMEGGADGA